jgi:iron complex outermembrane receptor protein
LRQFFTIQLNEMKNLLCLALFFLVALSISAQTELTGTVKEAKAGTPLMGATIYIPDLKLGAAADADGSYSIKQMPAGTYLLQVSFIGYASQFKEITIDGSVTENFLLTESRVELNEVIITGVGSATDRKKSPINVETMNSDQILEKASTNVIDAISKVPGVSAMTSGQSISKPVIRGLGYNRVLTISDGVQLVDQAWFDEFGIEADPNAVSRYEILKGPGSLAYGSDAISGVINLIPEKPLPEGQTKGEVLMNYQTNNGLIGTTANVSGTKNGISWGFRIGNTAAHAYQNKYDGYVLNSQFSNFNTDARLGIHRKWGYSQVRATYFDMHTGIVDGTRDSLSGKMMRQVSYPDLNGGEPTYVIPTRQEQTSYQPFTINQRIQHTKLIWDNSIAIGRGRMTGTFSWQRNQREESNDPTIPNTANIFYYSNGATYDLKYFAPQVNGFKITGGVNGVYQNSQSLGTLLLIPNYEFFQIGGYALVDKEIGKLNLSGGLRYTTRAFNEKDHWVDSTTQAPTTPNAPSSFHEFAGFNTTFSGVSFSAGGTYQFTDKFFMKANVARGWRAPNVSECAANGVHDGTVVYEVGDKNLTPETSLETDLTFGVNGKDVSFQMDLFNNSINNFIYARGLKGKNGTDSINNALNAAGLGEAPVYKFTQGNAQLYGGEAALSVHPTSVRWFEFNSALSMVYGGLKNVPDSVKYLPFVPPTRITADVRFNIKTGDALKNVFFRFGMLNAFSQNNVYRQFAIYNGLNTALTPYEYKASASPTQGYVLFNASVGGDIVSEGKTICRVFITCNNLFDTPYMDYMSRFKYNPVNYITHRVGVFNMGRNISFKVVIPLNFKR